MRNFEGNWRCYQDGISKYNEYHINKKYMGYLLQTPNITVKWKRIYAIRQNRLLVGFILST